MAQSSKLATTTAVMRKIESAFAAVDSLPAKQKEFVLTWARGEFLADDTDKAEGDSND